MKTLAISLLVLFTAASAQAEEVAPADAFAQTMVAGQKKFALKNVSVSFTQSVKGKTEKWTEKCSAKGEINLSGVFPRVSLSVPGVECAKHQARELSLLALLSSRLIYTAAHIPAYPDEQNQFRLDLAERVGGSVIRWNSQRALNANLRKGTAFMDFLGEEKGPLGWPDNKNHFVEISFRDREEGKPRAFEMSYTLDEDAGSHTEIQVNADLELL